MSHITGGGFIENIPRVLPPGTGCTVDAGAYQLPPVFSYLMRNGGIAPKEMARTFNCGIGMVLVVAKDKVEAVLNNLKEAGESAVYTLGEVTDKPGVDMLNLDSWA